MEFTEHAESLEAYIGEYVPDSARIGLVTAVEMSAVKRRYGYADEVFHHMGYTVYMYSLERIFGEENRYGELYVIKSGPGEINAAAATQFLISNYFVDVVLNFGVAGGLYEDIKVGNVYIVDQLVHYTFDCSELGEHFPAGRHGEYDDVLIQTDRTFFDLAEKAAGVPRCICASGDRFVGNTDSRRGLRQQFGADLAEMEAAGIFMTADRNGVPSLFIKGISDTAGTASDMVTAHFTEAADNCFEVMHRVIEALYRFDIES